MLWGAIRWATPRRIGFASVPIDGVPASPLLVVAAFGAEPGMTPLPAARTPAESWLRAVALGGQGYYARARAELVRATPAPSPVDSLLCSTAASFVRQLGGHRRAAELDGRAFALAGSDPDGAAARADALTGLAADALGTGRLRLSARLLERCTADLVDTGDLWRQRLRLAWVETELALATGDGARALAGARRADALALDCPSERHRVKSQLLLAAATCVDGRVEQSLRLAREVAHRCAEHGLLPLRWAAAMLCDGIDPAGDHAADVARCAAEIERRGGSFMAVL